MFYYFFFFFNDTATTEIYTLSLHDALPICRFRGSQVAADAVDRQHRKHADDRNDHHQLDQRESRLRPLRAHFIRVRDRKSTRLNSSHLVISYAVFCLKKKKTHPHPCTLQYR